MISRSPEPDSDVDCTAALSAAEQMVAEGIPLRREVLLDWMQSPCVDVQSVAFAILFDPPAGAVIPDAQTINQFFLDYLDRRLRDRGHSSHTPSQYLAGHLVRAWFERLWRTDPRPENLLAQIRDLLGRLLLNGDERVYDAVALGVLEHLFAEPSIVEFFSSWQHDPALRTAFLEAVELAHTDRPDGPADDPPKTARPR